VSSTIVESQVQILLLDIEGTTTPVDFVYKTLFPYARRKLESFILEHFREAEIASLIRQLHMQHDTDDSQGLQPPSWIHEQVESRLRSCIEFCKWLMGQRQKGNPSSNLSKARFGRWDTLRGNCRMCRRRSSADGCRDVRSVSIPRAVFPSSSFFSTASLQAI
jgi:hypothetical protein